MKYMIVSQLILFIASVLVSLATGHTLLYTLVISAITVALLDGIAVVAIIGLLVLDSYWTRKQEQP